MIGEKAASEEFIRDDTNKLVIKNHADLMKLASRFMTPRVHQTLCLMKLALVKEIDLASFDFASSYKSLILVALKLGQKSKEKGYINTLLQRGQAQSAVELARDVTLNVCKAVHDSYNPKSSKDTKTNAKDVLAEAGCIFEEFLLQHANIGSQSAMQNLPPHKHLLTHPPSLLTRLKCIHENYGTPDDLFHESQRREVSWLSDTTSVRDTMMKLYGNPRSNPQSSIVGTRKC